MAEKPKPGLEGEDAAEEPASPPRDDLPPGAGEQRGPQPAEDLGARDPDELAAEAAEALVTPEGLPAETSQPPDAMVLTGFLGASGRAGYRRLYLDVTLKDHVEIPEGEIRHLEWVGTERSVFGRKATLWIRRGAALDYTTVRP